MASCLVKACGFKQLNACQLLLKVGAWRKERIPSHNTIIFIVFTLTKKSLEVVAKFSSTAYYAVSPFHSNPSVHPIVACPSTSVAVLFLVEWHRVLPVQNGWFFRVSKRSRVFSLSE
eukprot:6443271-Amphidinium_carterae.1